MEGYVTTKEAAEQLGISGARIRKMIADGLIKAEKFGRDNVIPIDEIKKLENTERKAGRPKKETAKK